MDIYSFAKQHLLSNLTLKIVRIGAELQILSDYTEQRTENGWRVTYKPAQGVEKIVIDAVCTSNAVTFFIDAALEKNAGAFSSERGIAFTLGDLKPDKILGSYHDRAWWMMPNFVDRFEDIGYRNQGMLIKNGSESIHLLGLCGDDFRGEMCPGGDLCLMSSMNGKFTLHGAFVTIAASEDPFDAVAINYRAAHDCGAIRIPLRDEREMPDVFNGFGYCTWDSFYENVSSEKIYQKLEEFRSKNIPVRWVLIDDGWMDTENGRLRGFGADREKFPEGLKAAVAKMKREYGVEKVGVWHAFFGYWDGVADGSPLYEEQKQNLFRNETNRIIPAPDTEKAFRFWDAWHSYLRDCGIDFVKVDGQSFESFYFRDVMPTAEVCRRNHAALDRSVNKNFGGAVINCMGMDMENVFARTTAISRNSDDFYPNRQRGFIKHLCQNVYSAIWHAQIYFCDFDMWWSDHESAVQSGVLRAISGSAIYVSDELDRSRRETIIPTVEDDGTVMFCDLAALPTRDCVYTNCEDEKKLQKIWNKSGKAFAVAAFNVNQCDVTDEVVFKEVPCIDANTEYVAYEYFTKKFQRVTANTSVSLTLPENGVAVWSVYPVEHDSNGDYIMLGNTEKYVPIASKNKTKTYLENIM